MFDPKRLTDNKQVCISKSRVQTQNKIVKNLGIKRRGYGYMERNQVRLTADVATKYKYIANNKKHRPINI